MILLTPAMFGRFQSSDINSLRQRKQSRIWLEVTNHRSSAVPAPGAPPGAGARRAIAAGIGFLWRLPVARTREESLDADRCCRSF